VEGAGNMKLVEQLKTIPKAKLKTDTNIVEIYDYLTEVFKE
jgi:hypothetical protein